MIRPLLLLSIVLVFSSFSLQRKKKKLIPPGTVQISETFFADQTEISNFSWREFELWTKAKYGSESPEHLAVLPDSSVWLNKNNYCEPYYSYYYWHPAYKDFPVVGISYYQAIAFCKLRTERVKEFVYIRYKKEWNIEYRLPSKEEWEKISFTVGSPFHYNQSGKNEKGNVLLNFKRADKDTLGIAGANKSNADVTAPVYSYGKNAFGIYNTFGNVAEMISEKGVCKGGSWNHTLEECRPGKSILYEKPAAWLGFRCVCVVKDK
jgi:formylglycine-generating enzyme required for sulfatase activity